MGRMRIPSDNGGRRLGLDRRNFTYSAHIPERRNGVERRSMKDRRYQVESDGTMADRHYGNGFGM